MADAPSWREIRYHSTSAVLGFYLLCALTGWGPWLPRWFLLSVAWASIVIDGTATVVACVLRCYLHRAGSGANDDPRSRDLGATHSQGISK